MLSPQSCVTLRDCHGFYAEDELLTKQPDVDEDNAVTSGDILTNKDKGGADCSCMCF